MQSELKEYHTSGSDFAIPVDKKGTVIFFSVNGNRYFFNGHTGLFYDSLPEYAQKSFEALIQPERQRDKTFRFLIKQYGSDCNDLLKEIGLFQDDTHPDLAS